MVQGTGGEIGDIVLHERNKDILGYPCQTMLSALSVCDIVGSNIVKERKWQVKYVAERSRNMLPKMLNV